MNVRPDLIVSHAGPTPEAPIQSAAPYPVDSPRQRRELRILLLEDNPPHAELVEHFLRDSGLEFKITRVETRDAFIDQIDHHPPDMILSDYALPSFDGYAALAIAKDRVPNIPFIFVTGTMGEEVAIET
jgi:CheY-like chemotaxis protein